MVFILAVVVGLVAWALHLMQQAIDQREFSLMLAGLLVSGAAAGLVTVYLLMSNCVSYMTEMPHYHYSQEEFSEMGMGAPGYLFEAPVDKTSQNTLG